MLIYDKFISLMLRILNKDIESGNIYPLDENLKKRIEDLVKDVQVNLDEPLNPEDE